MQGSQASAGKRGAFCRNLPLLLLVSVAFSCSAPHDDSSLGPKEGCLVLAYHRVTPSMPVIDWIVSLDDYTLYQNTFEEQIHSMKLDGVHFITPQQLEAIVRDRRTPPDKCVLVTLDDGDISQYRYAFPVLRQEHVPFALFVISGQVGSSNFNGLEMATWPQIREMAESGLATVGSHTHNLHLQDQSHQPVFAKPEKTQQFLEDLQQSMLTIQRETGQAPKYFAYPFGFGIPQTDDAALRVGMRLLFSLRAGVEKPGDASFYVKRLMVTPRNWHTVDAWITRPAMAQR